MSQRQTTAMVMIGAIVAFISGIVFVVYLFQPWRTCPGEDSSAGCAMLQQDAVAMFIAFLFAVGGVVLFTVGLAAERTRNRR